MEVDSGMAKLDAAQIKGIASLLRKYLSLMRELTAAKSILRACEESERVPYQWQEALEQAVSSPEHNTSAEQLEALIHHLEQEADESGLIPLLEKFSKESPTN